MHYSSVMLLKSIFCC